ncbi:MAG: S-methyl-5'-thioadenosine phosphorylase [Acidimicrobiia bacterium]
MIGVFGGSGLYRFLERTKEITLSTPYGEPTAPVTIGRVGSHEVAFLPRHGVRHQFPPHRINFRANLHAFRDLGVTRVLAPCASGSLRPEIEPGHFVACDQLIDMTSGRSGTFFDGPTTNHISFADPYCEELRTHVVATARRRNDPVHDAGTVVVINGPRFATRAESRWYRNAGADVINMTQAPEAPLARELGLCYTAVALITDYDTGVEGLDHIAPVTQEEVMRFFDANIDRVRDLLVATIESLPEQRSCACAGAPNGFLPEPPPAP